MFELSSSTDAAKSPSSRDPGVPTQDQQRSRQLIALGAVFTLIAGGLALAVYFWLNPAIEEKSGPPQSFNAKIDELAAMYLDRRPNASLVVGALRDGQRWVKAYHRGDDAPDGDTIFEMGSASRVLLGLVLADAVQRGEVDYDDNLISHLPSSVVGNHTLENVTLRKLATGTSGFPNKPKGYKPLNEQNPYAEYTAKQLYDDLNKTELRPISQSFRSFIGAGSLGHALEHASELSYEQMLVERICKPLKLDSTSITVSDENASRFIRGLDNDGLDATRWDFDVLVAAGGVRSSVNDMLTLLETQLNPIGAPLENVVIDSQTVHHKGDLEDHVALFWTITEGQDRLLYWHGGGTGGYTCAIAFDPRNKWAIVLMSNYGDRLVSDVSLEGFMFQSMDWPGTVELEDGSALD